MRIEFQIAEDLARRERAEWERRHREMVLQHLETAIALVDTMIDAYQFRHERPSDDLLRVLVALGQARKHLLREVA